MNLETLTRQELLQLQADVEKALKKLEVKNRAAALRAAEDAAKEFGFSLSDLTTEDGKPASAPKYQTPADPTQTWTGRGRKPKWIVDALESGKDLDELKV